MFTLISQFLGYRNKTDVTNLPPGVLVAGSQNVVSNDGERIAARKGYTLDGAAASGTLYPIIASYEWKTNRGIEHALRRYNDTLQVRYADPSYTFTDNFTRASVGSDYTATGAWGITSNVLVSPGPSGWNNTCLSVAQYTDFIATAKMRGVNANGNVQLIFRGSGGAGYGAQIRIGDGVFRLENYGVTNLGQVSKSLSLGTWYRVKVQAQGTALKAKIWVDGADEPSTWDIEVTNALFSTGKIGFSSESLNAEFDDLQITTLPTTVTWNTLKTGLATSGVNKVTSRFAEFWDNTNKLDQLLMTDGSANVYSWTGARAILASATATTVTKSGSETWAQAGFSPTGTIVINGTLATYSGGANTTTLTGVSVNFNTTSAGTPVYDSMIANAVSSFTDTNVSMPNDYLVDLITVLNNQVVLGSLSSREVYLSRVSSFSNFSKSSPRVTGEGEVITLDATAVGFAVGDYKDDQTLNIAAGDFWYVVLFNPSADQTREAVQIKRLKTQPQKGAKSQSYIATAVNDILFISNEPTFDSLGRVENIVTPQTKPLSDSIKTDFDAYDFETDGDIRYYKNFYYVTVPGEGIVLMLNVAKNWWEPPQTVPISKIAIIDGELYGHSSTQQETYKLFTGYNDNNAPIRAVAAFSYQNYGDRTLLKTFTEYYSEGYITPNTTLTQTHNYEYKGFTQVLSRDIVGSDADIIFATTNDVSLGANSLGEESLGGGFGDEESLPPKFRVINTYQAEDFFEHQVIYSSDDVDQQWELLACGPEVVNSTHQPTHIKD